MQLGSERVPVDKILTQIDDACVIASDAESVTVAIKLDYESFHKLQPLCFKDRPQRSWSPFRKFALATSFAASIAILIFIGAVGLVISEIEEGTLSVYIHTDDGRMNNPHDAHFVISHAF